MREVFKVLKTLFPWIITVVCVYIILSKVEFSKLFEVITQANPLFLGFAVVSSVIFALYVCVYKYKEILKYLGYNLPFSYAQLVKLGVLPLKTFLPFKLGEFFRAVYLNKHFKIPYRDGVLSIVLGYLLRFLVLFSFVATSFLTDKLYLWVLFNILLFLFYSIAIFKNYGVMFSSLLFEVFLLLNYIFIFSALGVKISLVKFVIFVSVLLIIESLPISVYGIGVREISSGIIFGGIVSIEKAVAAGLLGSFFNSVIPMLLSLSFLVKLTKSFVYKINETEPAKT